MEVNILIDFNWPDKIWGQENVSQWLDQTKMKPVVHKLNIINNKSFKPVQQ